MTIEDQIRKSKSQIVDTRITLQKQITNFMVGDYEVIVELDISEIQKLVPIQITVVDQSILKIGEKQ